MARRTPALARVFAGRWRVAEMDQWEDLDILEPAHITFTGKDSGELVFVAVEADLDVRYGSRDGEACAEFSWEGSDDNTPASGRGWVTLDTAGRLVGHVFIHKGDDWSRTVREMQMPPGSVNASRRAAMLMPSP